MFLLTYDKRYSIDAIMFPLANAFTYKGVFGCLFFSSLHVGKTKRGELSIFPKSFVVLSHCLHMMPRQKTGPGADVNLKVSMFCLVIDLMLCLL